jgi:hypothetical protein
MAAYFVQTCYACVWSTVQNGIVRNEILHSVLHMMMCTTHDDGLYKPKHVGTAFIIIIVFII